MILCLDFDGVIHSYASGWKGADVIPDPPVHGAMEFLQEALKHFEVHIFSSRSHQDGGIAAMCCWLRKHAGCSSEFPLAGGPAHWTDSVQFPTHKPSAMVTIDDRALTFDGTWPAIDTLKNFKPWNKR